MSMSQSQTSHSFPLLKAKETLSALKQIDIVPKELGIDDLRMPTVELVQLIYRQFVNVLSPSSDLDNIPEFAGLDAFQYRELHETSISNSKFLGDLFRLMDTVGIYDFSMSDLICPRAKRLMTHLSALINFTRFRADQQEILVSLSKRNESQLEEKRMLQSKHDELHSRAKALQDYKNENEEYQQSVLEEVEGLQTEFSEQSSALQALLLHVQTVKEQNTDSQERIASSKIYLETLNQQISKFKAQIVSDPQDLLQDVEKKSATIRQKKHELAELSESIVPINAIATQLKSNKAELNERMKELEVCENELRTLIAHRHEMAEGEVQVKANETAISELASNEAYLKGQVTKEFTKYSRARSQHEVKYSNVQVALREAQTKERSFQEKETEILAQIKHLDVLIKQKQDQIQRVKHKHEKNMELLYARSNQAQHQAHVYQGTLQAAMNSF